MYSSWDGLGALTFTLPRDKIDIMVRQAAITTTLILLMYYRNGKGHNFLYTVGCDDRGGEVLRPGDFTSWKFRMNFLGTNCYNCRFYWFEGADVRKFSEFVVFDKGFMELCDSFLGNRCYWYVTQEGFYFSSSNGSFPGDDWTMKHAWSNM